MRVKIIPDSCGRPYLTRLTLLELFGFSLKIHAIIQSDEEREHHDHPWSFWTLMLCGGYYEETLRETEHGKIIKRKWIKPGTLRFCKAPYPHRIELEKKITRAMFHVPENIETPAVTLVLTYPKFREWGFYSRMGWIHHKKYENSRKCDE